MHVQNTEFCVDQMAKEDHLNQFSSATLRNTENFNGVGTYAR